MYAISTQTLNAHTHKPRNDRFLVIAFLLPHHFVLLKNTPRSRFYSKRESISTILHTIHLYNS